VQPTMSIEVPSIQHPRWCSPTECLMVAPGGGVHLSSTARAHSRSTGLTVTVQVVQGRAVDGYPRSGRAFVSLGVRSWIVAHPDAVTPSWP
jgi:hypothetical protein